MVHYVSWRKVCLGLFAWGEMAALTFYLAAGLDANGWQAFATSPQVAATTTSGWIVSTGSTNHSELASGTERAASTFVGTTVPDGTLDVTLKDAAITPEPLNGSFEAGNWTFHFVMRAITAGGAADGRVRFRLITANFDGSGAVEITAGQQQASLVSNVSTSADFDSSLTFDPGAFDCNNKYVFLQIAWERTGAGGATNHDMHFRTGSDASTGTRFTTANFIPNGDVVIRALPASPQTVHCHRNTVFLDGQDQIGYHFFIDSDVDFKYIKTVDGGRTWGTPVVVIVVGTLVAFDVYYDRWTTGNNGTLIHMWYFDTTADDVLYRTLDTATDTLGTQRVVFAGATATAGNARFVSGAILEGGNLLCVFNIDSGDESGMYRSTDGGVNWTARVNPYEGAGVAGDIAVMYPAGTGREPDTNDAWIVYHDDSADSVTLKVYDDSANTLTESSGAGGTEVIANSTDGITQWPWASAVRKSDGYAFIVRCRAYDSVTGDVHIYRMRGADDGEAEFMSGELYNNTDDLYYPTIFIDETTGHLYVGFLGKNDGTEDIDAAVHAWYIVSTDDGISWSNPVQYSGGIANFRNLFSPPSGPRFILTWRDAGNRSLLTNPDSSVLTTPDPEKMIARMGDSRYNTLLRM